MRTDTLSCSPAHHAHGGYRVHTMHGHSQPRHVNTQSNVPNITLCLRQAGLLQASTTCCHNTAATKDRHCELLQRPHRKESACRTTAPE